MSHRYVMDCDFCNATDIAAGISHSVTATCHVQNSIGMEVRTLDLCHKCLTKHFDVLLQKIGPGGVADWVEAHARPVYTPKGN